MNKIILLFLLFIAQSLANENCSKKISWGCYDKDEDVCIDRIDQNECLENEMKLKRGCKKNNLIGSCQVINANEQFIQRVYEPFDFELFKYFCQQLEGNICI